MRIAPFTLERYFARYEFEAPYLLCCSDCESLPVRDLLHMEPGAAQAFEDLWLGYTESQGHPMLREQIARLYEGISPDQVLVHAGAEEAIFNAMNVMLQAGDHVIVHTPCYQSLFEVAQAIGCEVTPWSTYEEENWALDLDRLKQRIRANTKLVIVNCPHNPTGYLMPRDAFAELVHLSQIHGFTIFSDEVYRFLEYDPQDRLPALCEVDEQGISLGVMSKSFGLAGLRIGWIVTRNAGLFADMAAFKDYTTICCSAPSELLAEIALRHRETLVRRSGLILSANLERLDEFFQTQPDMFSWVRPVAGSVGFPRLLSGDASVFCHELVESTGVLLLPGTLFEDTGNHIRFGFGRKDLPEALALLARFLADP